MLKNKLKIIDKWKVIDISSNDIPQPLLNEIAFYGISYLDFKENDEHLYNAEDLLEKEKSEIIFLIEDEIEILKKIKKLQKKHNAFYFRIIKS